MRWRLVLAAVLLVPLIEIAVFVGVGTWLGFGWALLLILATSVLGGVVLRREGRRSLRRLQEVMESGEMPGQESSNGALRMSAGIALLLPGFVTDLIGLVLLVPPTRALVRGWLFRLFVRRVSPETANQMFGPRQVRVRRGKPGGPTTSDVIEGEVIDAEVVDEHVTDAQPVPPPGDRSPH